MDKRDKTRALAGAIFMGALIEHICSPRHQNQASQMFEGMAQAMRAVIGTVDPYTGIPYEPISEESVGYARNREQWIETGDIDALIRMLGYVK